MDPMSGRSWRRIGVVVLMLGAAAVGILEYRSRAPEWMRRQILGELEGIWSGPVIIDNPRYSPFGPLQIGAISFIDASGHPWARAEQIVLILKDWPILGSPLREIRAQNLHVAVLLDPNHPIPLDRSIIPDKGGNLFGTIRVDRCSVDLIGPKGSRISYRDLAWQLNPIGDQLQLLLLRNPSDSSDFAFAQVRADPSKGRVSGRIDLAHTVRPEEIRLAQPFLPFPQTVMAEGLVRTELEFSGTGPDFEDLQVDGTLSVSNGTLIDESGRPFLQEAQASVRFLDNWLSVESASGSIGDGTISANLMATWSRFAIDELSGQMAIQGVDLARSGYWFPKNFPLARGTADLDYVFFMTQAARTVGGYGRFRLADADLMQLPVIPDLFSPLGLPAAQPVTLSDGLLDFTHSGPTLRIDQARIFNSVAALIAEPEGTIRLDDGSLDLYVVAVPVQALEDAVSRIPVIRSFNRAANKLVRLHVLGNWSDPPDRLIRKEPLEDLQQGAKGLLEDLSGGAADLADRFRRAGRSLWQDWFGDRRQESPQTPPQR
jgi:hypothetical protein